MKKLRKENKIYMATMYAVEDKVNKTGSCVSKVNDSNNCGSKTNSAIHCGDKTNSTPMRC